MVEVTGVKISAISIRRHHTIHVRQKAIVLLVDNGWILVVGRYVLFGTAQFLYFFYYIFEVNEGIEVQRKR